MAALLKAWRREIDSVPLPPPIDPALATAVVRSAPPRRRAVRPMIAVAAAIAGLLVGSAAIGARSATPDTVLWPVTQLLWADRADGARPVSTPARASRGRPTPSTRDTPRSPRPCIWTRHRR